MRRAFTLVELLVVIGIIGLLIAVLLPALAQAREASLKTACLAQLADVGRSLQMYRNDHDDRLPPAAIHPVINTVQPEPLQLPELHDLIAPYTDEGRRVLQCPADTVLAPDETIRDPDEPGVSYFYNAELGTTRLADTVTFKIFGDPTRVPVLRDGDTYHGGPTPFATLFYTGHAEGNFWPDPDEMEQIRDVDPGNFFQGFDR